MYIISLKSKHLLFKQIKWSLALNGLAPFSNMNIEALCAAPPEALTHSPSQMPLSCPVALKAAQS